MPSDKTLLQPKPPDYADESKYRRLESGAVLEIATGKLVAMDPDRNPWAITKDNAAEMNRRGAQIRRERAIVSALRGIARGAGIELPPDADLEQITAGALDSWEALIAHATRLGFDAKSGRTIEAVLSLIKQIMLGNLDQDPDQDTPQNIPTARAVLILAELARKRQDPDAGREVIDITPAE